MRRPFLLTAIVVVLAAAGLLSAWSASGSSSMTLIAKLSTRAERPAPKGGASATGVFLATLKGSSLSWRLTFSHLTGRAAAAHIHIGRIGVAGPVAVPLCGPCASGAHGSVRLTAKTRAEVLAGHTYVNVHTARNAAGEIRGQIYGGIAPIPTTTTYDIGGGYGGYG
jgi:CHRD domain